MSPSGTIFNESSADGNRQERPNSAFEERLSSSILKFAINIAIFLSSEIYIAIHSNYYAIKIAIKNYYAIKISIRNYYSIQISIHNYDYAIKIARRDVGCNSELQYQCIAEHPWYWRTISLQLS